MTNQSPPLYITGADDHLLANLFMLLEAVAQCEPHLELKVCDFGFSDPVRTFLSEIGVLLARPALLSGKDHPWYAKAAMADYLPDDQVTDRGFVWIDADIIPLKSFDEPVAALADTLRCDGKSVALCPDDCGYTLSEFIDVWRSRNRDIAPFARQLAERKVSTEFRYLNTGFIICTDLSFAHSWRNLVLQQHIWLLFEQNSFNSLAYENPQKLITLDTLQWNAHGSLLDEVSADGSGATYFAHATSAGDRHVDGELNVGVGDKSMRMNLKLFTRDDLRGRQLAHLQEFMNRHVDALIRHGLLK